MNKSFYTFANFFLTLIVCAGVLTAVVHFFTGAYIAKLESFKNWHLTVSIVNLVGSIFLLKYYYFKRYRLAFYSGIIAVITSIGFAFIYYMMLVRQRQFEAYYIAGLYSALITGIIYSFSLIVSSASKPPWLKAAGILYTISGVILLATAIWFFNSQDIALKLTLESIHQWTSRVTSLVPVLFIMHLRAEEALHIRNKDFDKTPTAISESWLGLAAVIAFGFTLFFGINIANQTYRLDHVSASARVIAQPFEARYYVNGKGDTLRYRFMKPLDYNPEKKYPLVVCPHHGGTHGTDNIRQVEGSWAAYLSRTEYREKYPAFLFVPQCPRDAGWGNYPDYPAIDTLIFEAMEALEKEFSIDAKRCYSIGVSGGGYASWHFITARPAMFAAAVPICGGGNPKLAHNIVDGKVAVWAFHGEQDDLVPVSYSRDMIAAIKKAGGKPRYTEFKYLGHNMGNAVENTPGLLDWLFAQKRE
ncbi:carboxylesterase family protein [Dyadobacter pollutisoli]|uniref:Prolyl oligopeptidase family serine peptidase n=1 Tax=Dyadobacter pollutisoli TaxID=2910158 RepID=A0A9E8NDA9_9BACT|nr:prolyl oligopeptidase family serine peptidase [Dyadobacter pollutisoli]WAC14620.1 prolyl oligopeptidase family serine peptidase [Dyadobacter pollutisoli]